MDIAVETRALRRVYKTHSEQVVALDGVDLQINRGECFGVLGPNGAGKTTLIKILVTLLLPSSGQAFVDGLDIATQFRSLRHRISVVSGGENVGFGMLTVREQLWMFSQLYGLPSSVAYGRIDELLKRTGLADASGRLVRELSSGMRQKMNLIRGLMTNPRVLFLDEPTVALDVGAARDVREEIRRWMREDRNRTVILTTHYMHEADDLCDRLAIVNHGRIVALGEPAELKHQVQEQAVIDLRVTPGTPLLDTLRAIDGVSAATVAELDGSDVFSLLLHDDGVLPRLLNQVERSGRQVQNIQKREPSLEDAFVKLVGRSMLEEENPGA
jgi:ABC-2 type transport system ATP-binding protein